MHSFGGVEVQGFLGSGFQHSGVGCKTAGSVYGLLGFWLNQQFIRL